MSLWDHPFLTILSVTRGIGGIPGSPRYSPTRIDPPFYLGQISVKGGQCAWHSTDTYCSQGFADGININSGKSVSRFFCVSFKIVGFKIVCFSYWFIHVFDLSYPMFDAPTTNIGTAVNLAHSLESSCPPSRTGACFSQLSLSV